MKKIIILFIVVLMLIPNFVFAKVETNISATVDPWLEINYSTHKFSISTNISQGTVLIVENQSEKDYYDDIIRKSKISYYNFPGQTTSSFDDWFENSQNNIFIYVTNNF